MTILSRVKWAHFVTCKGQNSLLRAFGTGKQWEKAVTSLSMVTDISSNAILSACEKPLGIKDELMTHHLVRIIGTIGCEDLHRGNYESVDICICMIDYYCLQSQTQGLQYIFCWRSSEG